MSNYQYIKVNSGEISDSEEIYPGIVVDYDQQDKVIGVELDFSLIGRKPRTVPSGQCRDESRAC